MARILSIDFGKKRTGIAVTDPAQIIANGLTTIETHHLLSFLTDYTKKEQVERILVGLPVQLNGLPSENQARVRQFVKKLTEKLPQIPVEYYDERFTSALAHQAILDGGIRKKQRRTDKGLVDEVSACIILQSYMEQCRFKRSLHHEQTPSE